MTKIIINDQDEARWDEFLLSNQRNNFLQSYQYGEFYKSLGQKIWRLSLEDGEKIVGTALIVQLQTKFGSFLYCPSGPVLVDLKNSLPLFLDAFRKIARDAKVDFIRLDPRILNDDEGQLFSQSGLKEARYFTQPECTQILSLEDSLEIIRSNFGESTRYNIGWVERKGVKVKISQIPDEIDIFVDLLKETSRRQHFRLHGKEDYYKKQYLALREKNLAKLFLAYEPEKDGNEVLAAAIVVNCGDTVTYLHSASSSKNPKLRAPYLMQWKIIEDAKISGFKKYDFWGVSPNDDPKDPWRGVTDFKKSFGGEKVCYHKPYDLVLSPKYQLTTILDEVRHSLRKLI